MSLKPPVRDDVVRMTGLHDQTQPAGPGEVIRRDSFFGTRKLITIVRRRDNGWRLEADVFGILDEHGYLRQDLVSQVNLMCMAEHCTANIWLGKSNKDFYFDINPKACVKLGDGPAPGVAYDGGALTGEAPLQCPYCLTRFRISGGIWAAGR